MSVVNSSWPAGTARDLEVAGLLRDQLSRLFSRVVTREALARSERDETDRVLWDEISAIGAESTFTAERFGGAALSWRDGADLVRLLGSHLPPVPLGETMMARWLLSTAGLHPPEGPLTLAPSLLDLDDDGRVRGEDSLVSWVPGAESVLVCVRSGASRRLALISVRDIQASQSHTLDRWPASRVVFRGAPVEMSAPAPAVLGDSGLLAPLAILRSLQIAGNLTQILALCVDYANARSQFGKTIGKFQAIQHLLAELAEHTAAAKVASGFAARQLDHAHAEEAERGAAVAKIRTGASATRGAAIAHQVFGAIGITDEHILHYHTRRLWQWRAEAGSESSWAEWLGNRVLSARGESLWSTIVAGGSEHA